jgi:thiol:disulfide interchange protein DsbD
MQLSFLSVIQADTPAARHSRIALLCLLIHSAALAQLPASPFANRPAFLDIDQAFRFYASLDSDEQISIHWDIEPGYYLYADKFSFRITEPDDIAGVLIPTMPAGTAHEDEFFGKVSVYYTQTRAQLQLPYDSPSEFTLEIGFQGCAEAGLCYPPTLKQLEILR